MHRAEKNMGKCKYCGSKIYWVLSAKNNKPMPLQIKTRTIVDINGEIHQGNEPHHAYCEPYQQMLQNKDT